MDSSLAQDVAPLGCYSHGSGIGCIQRSTQSYIHSSIRRPGLAERKEIIRRILSSRRDDRELRAAVECYFFRTARVGEWHILRDDQKSARVCEFISNVWAAAQGVSTVIGREEVHA